MSLTPVSTLTAWNKRITLAITGASGTPYALRLLELLVKADFQVYVLISSAAKVVMATEENLKVPSKYFVNTISINTMLRKSFY